MPSSMPSAPRAISSGASRSSSSSVGVQAGPVPARLGEDRGVLGDDDEHRVEPGRDLGVPDVAQPAGERARQRLRRPRDLVDDARAPSAANTVTAEAPGRHPARHRAAAPTASPPRPRRSRARPCRAGPASARSTSPRTAAADVADHQLQRPPDRRVRPGALAQRVAARVHPDPARDRAVDQDRRAGAPRGGEQAVGVELLGAGGLDGGEHHGQVLGAAAGEDGVDGDLLDGRRHEVRGHGGDDLVGRARRARPASAAPAPASAPRPAARRSSRGRSSASASSSSAGELDAPGVQLVPAGAHQQLLGHRRVVGARAAARRPVGRSAPRSATPDSSRPARPVPALDAVGLRAVPATQQRRHDRRCPARGSRRGRCRRRRRRRRGTPGRPGCRRWRRGRREHRRDQLAGRAVLLDHHDEPVVGDGGGHRRGHGRQATQAGRGRVENPVARGEDLRASHPPCTIHMDGVGRA